MITETLIAALIVVESGGRDDAVGKAGEVGCLQITPAVVADCNRLMKGNVFSLDDREDRELSIRMATLWLTFYVSEDRLGREPTNEDYARCWNGGPDWQRNPRATDRYWLKVMTLCGVAKQ